MALKFPVCSCAQAFRVREKTKAHIVVLLLSLPVLNVLLSPGVRAEPLIWRCFRPFERSFPLWTPF